MQTIAANEGQTSVIAQIQRARGDAGQLSAYVQTIVEQTGVSPGQAVQFWGYQWASWFAREQILLHADEVQAGDLVQTEAIVRAVYRSDSAGGEWLAAARGSLNPDAVRYIDNLLAQPD